MSLYVHVEKNGGLSSSTSLECWKALKLNAPASADEPVAQFTSVYNAQCASHGLASCQYLQELQQDEYGNNIEQHDNIMKDDRDNDTITQSRSKSTNSHHGWKAKEYKTMPAGKSIPKQSDDNGNGQSRSKFVRISFTYLEIHW